jgi:hypothetical protein
MGSQMPATALPDRHTWTPARSTDSHACCHAARWGCRLEEWPLCPSPSPCGARHKPVSLRSASMAHLVVQQRLQGLCCSLWLPDPQSLLLKHQERGRHPVHTCVGMYAYSLRHHARSTRQQGPGQQPGCPLVQRTARMWLCPAQPWWQMERLSGPAFGLQPLCACPPDRGLPMQNRCLQVQVQVPVHGMY